MWTASSDSCWGLELKEFCKERPHQHADAARRLARRGPDSTSATYFHRTCKQDSEVRAPCSGQPRLEADCARPQMAGTQDVRVRTEECSCWKRKEILSHATQLTLEDLCAVR